MASFARQLSGFQLTQRPSPAAAQYLHSRKVRIDRAASDLFMTHEVLAEMHETPLRGRAIIKLSVNGLHRRSRFPGRK